MEPIAPVTRGDQGRLAKITAVVRADQIDEVERSLLDLRVPGVSITKVKGFGEYVDFFAPGWTTEHARLEIFLQRDRAPEVARAIIDAARTGGAGDGIVVVQDVVEIFRIRSGERLSEPGGWHGEG